MTTGRLGVSEPTETEIENLEMILGDLEIDEITELEAIEDSEVVEVTDELTNLDIAASEVSDEDLEQIVGKIESYEGQVSTAALIVSESAAASKPIKVKSVRAAGTAKTPKVRLERNLSDLPSTAFSVDLLAMLSSVEMEAQKVSLILSRPTQVKIAEKFDQLILSNYHGKKPSVYVADCFRALDLKKEATSSELVAMLRATPVPSRPGETYAEGTARAQVGQMMVLFPLLGIATRTGQTLKLLDKSEFARILRILIA